jgi:hypothetical protein
VGARLQSDVKVGTRGQAARFLQSKDFGMGFSGPGMKTFPDNGVIAYQHRANRRIGGGPPLAPAGQLQGQAHIFFFRKHTAPGIQKGLFLFQQVFQLIHELVDILELAVDGSEADVGDLVDTVQSLHNRLTDTSGINLFFTAFLKAELQAINDLFDGLNGNGTFLARTLNAGNNFLALEHLPPAVLFYDQGKGFLHSLKSRETALADNTLAPAPDNVPFLAQT